jgi:hypothetical protein
MTAVKPEMHNRLQATTTCMATLWCVWLVTAGFGFHCAFSAVGSALVGAGTLVASSTGFQLWLCVTCLRDPEGSWDDGQQEGRGPEVEQSHDACSSRQGVGCSA